MLALSGQCIAKWTQTSPLNEEDTQWEDYKLFEYYYRDDNNYTVWLTSIPLGPKVPSKYWPSFHSSSTSCIILCILHHEWIVTVVVTFVQICHPAGRRQDGSRRRSRRRRTERRRVSTRLNIIFWSQLCCSMNILWMFCDRDDNNYTVWSTWIPLWPKVPSKYSPSFHSSSSCCIILCIIHHEWIVTVVVTFIQIDRHERPAWNGRLTWSRTDRRVSTRLNNIFLKLVVLF